ISTAELRDSAEMLMNAALASVQADDSERLGSILIERSSTRIEDGFSLAEFLGALFSIFPAARRVVRESGLGSDPAFAPSYEELEMRMQAMAFEAADLFAKVMQRQLESKNQELHRLNKKLVTSERVASMEASAAVKALSAANEFNSRVIESLSSGLFVADAKSRKIVLWSGRMAEITGIPAEDALGRDAIEILEQLEGIDGEGLVRAVRKDGRLPVRKVRLTKPDGRTLWVYLRAHRMYHEDGEPEGTVGLIDDITERELLIDSFSRYVSRDVVRKVGLPGNVWAQTPVG
ncbi:MAG: PAS domain-containing protein, partial [Polyangia bacterium]